MWRYVVESCLFTRAIVGADCFGTYIHTLYEQGFDQYLLPAQFYLNAEDEREQRRAVWLRALFAQKRETH